MNMVCFLFDEKNRNKIFYLNLLVKSVQVKLLAHQNENISLITVDSISKNLNSNVLLTSLNSFNYPALLTIDPNLVNIFFILENFFFNIP